MHGRATSKKRHGTKTTPCTQGCVSCPELDALVDAARAAGAIGAKMSGTGRGGLMIALTPSAAVQDKVKEALSKLAPQVWTTFLA